jgi:hypothetical protein
MEFNSGFKGLSALRLLVYVLTKRLPEFFQVNSAAVR